MTFQFFCIMIGLIMKNGLAKFKSLFGFQDLTRNARPIKVMILFAIPLIITALINNGMSLINSMVLKETVGGDSVTAINQTSSLSAILLQFGFGCTSGFGVIIANLHGAKDEEGVKKAIVSSIILCFIIWIIVCVVGLIFLKPLLNFLHVHELYYDKAYAYFIVILVGYIFTLLSNLSGHILRALGNSFIVLVSSVITIGLQIGFCFLLTVKNIANLDTIGAGIALVSASFINFIICSFFVFKKYHINKSSFKIEKNIYKDLLKLGLPIGFQWSILFVGTFVLNSQVNLFGAYAAKGMAVYSSWETLAINSFMAAIGVTVSNYVGQNYGIKNYKKIKQGIIDGYILAGIFYLFMLAILLPTVRLIPYIYLPKVEVNERVQFYSSTYLYITISACILQGIIVVSRGALQGIKKPLFPFIAGLGELGARIGISLFIPYLIDKNYKQTLSDASYVGISFSNASAWLISALIMAVAVIILIYRNKQFKETIDNRL